MDIIYTLIGIGLGWAIVIWLDRNVFNKSRNRRKEDQSMGKELLLYAGFGFMLYVVGSVGWAFLSLVYTWVNCKMNEWGL